MQMAAAQKFRAPESTAAQGETPSATSKPIQEESEEEEVIILNLSYVLINLNC